jgi:lycopene cyclase domain-containing protein
MKGEYLLIELLILGILVLVYRHYKLNLFSEKGRIIKTMATTSVIYIIWETLALSRGHWGFGDEFILAYIWIFPIEELIFITIIAVFVPIILWEISKKVGKKWA